MYQGLPALGREVLENLWKNDTTKDSYYYEILNEQVLSNYVLLKADKNKVLLNAVKGVEDEYKIADKQREKNKALYLIEYIL